MKKWNRILLAVPLAIVAGGIAWLALRGPPEPVYQGKTLSAWVEQDNAPGYERTEAEMAIAQMGTNALPYLMKMTAARDSGLKNKLIALLRRQSIVRIHFRPAIDYHWTAIEALNLILPTLTNHLTIDENETKRWQIVAELEDAGIHVTEMPPGRTPVLSVRRAFIEDKADDITELCKKGLTNALSDKSFKVRSAATNALKRIDAAEARTAAVK